MFYQAGIDPQVIIRGTDVWNQQHAGPLKQFIRPHSNDCDPSRRIRVGYVSADFYGHASSLFLVPLFEHHDCRKCRYFVTHRFPVLMMSLAACSGASPIGEARWISPMSKWPARSGRTKSTSSWTSSCTPLSTGCWFSPASRPDQVTWLGYPGSTGLSTVDYRLSDLYLIRRDGRKRI